jgi:uncharacterized LabA/DUF88 family protein
MTDGEIAAHAPGVVLRTCVFLDFWNFNLGLSRWDSTFNLDWKAFGPWLSERAVKVVDPAARASYGGLRIYASHDPKKSVDDGLRTWLSNTLSRFPGVTVIQKERRPKDAPSCPKCHLEVSHCPHCAASMKGTNEKGIDTAIVTDMIRLAWEGTWDVAVLISADADFVPAVEFLSQKDKKVVHAAFPPMGAELSKKCWASLDITDHLRTLHRGDKKPRTIR